MSLYSVILFGGVAIAAFLVLHNIAGTKQDGDQLLSTYRDLLAGARKKRAAAQVAKAGESTESEEDSES